jgi:hypothetical protein
MIPDEALLANLGPLLSALVYSRAGVKVRQKFGGNAPAGAAETAMRVLNLQLFEGAGRGTSSTLQAIIPCITDVYANPRR